MNSATGQIARTFWAYNETRGFDPTILCSSPQVPSVPTLDRAIEIDDNNLVRHALGLFREMGFPDVCHCPDQRRFSWMPFVLRYFDKHLCTEHFDYIHSISCPETSHLIAYNIKRRTALPWIAQFNDPWIGNEAKRFKTKCLKKADDKLERLVAVNADLIIHSNRIIFEDWTDRYGDIVKDKMVILPFSFNIPVETEHAPSLHPSPLKIHIYHIGTLYGKRSAKTFFDALALFRNRYPDESDKVEVTFIGGVSESEKNYATHLRLHDTVKYIGYMPPEQLEAYYKHSDLFLVIDMNVGRSPSYPSKLMLCHYYRKPIMSITTNDSIIMDDMRQSGHNAFLYDDTEGMADHLHRAVTDYPSLLHFDHNHWRSFTVENVTSLYKEQLHKLSIL